MWLNLLSLGVKTGARIYQNKQRTKQLMSDAQMRHAEQMAKGEIEYKQELLRVMIMVGKTNLSWFLIFAILLLGWSVFSDDPTIRDRIDLFLNNLNIISIGIIF